MQTMKLNNWISNVQTNESLIKKYFFYIYFCAVLSFVNVHHIEASPLIKVLATIKCLTMQQCHYHHCSLSRLACPLPLWTSLACLLSSTLFLRSFTVETFFFRLSFIDWTFNGNFIYLLMFDEDCSVINDKLINHENYYLFIRVKTSKRRD